MQDFELIPHARAEIPVNTPSIVRLGELDAFDISTMQLGNVYKVDQTSGDPVLDELRMLNKQMGELIKIITNL
jgi:hypothetical protein